MSSWDLKGAVEGRLGVTTAIAIPSEFQFHVNPSGDRPMLQDFVVVEHPNEEETPVLGKIVRLSRFNPLLPEESTMELARQGIEAELSPLPLSGRMEMIAAACKVIGFIDPFGRFRNPGFPVRPGSTVYKPSAAFMEDVLGEGATNGLNVGHLRNRVDVALNIDANEILNKHLAILAMTGAGKTYASSVILEELMQKGYPLFIVDPHGDYVNLGKGDVKFKLSSGSARQYRFSSFNNSLDLSILRRREFVDFVEGLSEEDLTGPQRALLGSAYDHAKRAKGDMLEGIHRYLSEEAEPKSKATLGAVFRKINAVRGQLRGVDSTLKMKQIVASLGLGRGVILDMTRLSALVQRINVQLILERLFDFRKDFLSGGGTPIPPLFIVIEEAHSFAPAQAEGETFASRAIIRRIATEGRKFGFGLCVISQRPSRLDATVLSQCNSQLILRVVNPNDQNYIQQTVESLAKEDLWSLPDLAQGEALLGGTMVTVPTLVQVRDRITPEGIPAVNRIEEIQGLLK